MMIVARSAVASLNGTLLKGEKLTVSPMVERRGVVGGKTVKITIYSCR